LKWIAGTLAFLLIWTTAAQEARAVSLTAEARPEFSSPDPDGGKFPFALPSQIAQLKELHVTGHSSTSNPFIVQIQDAHANPSAA